MPRYQIDSDTKKYLQGLLIDSGFEHLKDDEETLSALFERLDNYLTTVIFNRLPANKRDQYAKMIEKGRPPDLLTLPVFSIHKD